MESTCIVHQYIQIINSDLYWIHTKLMAKTDDILHAELYSAYINIILTIAVKAEC